MADVAAEVAKLPEADMKCNAGVRIPDSDFIRGVCQQNGGAIALTSANLSGALSPLCVNDFMELWPQCAAVFNGLRIEADRAGSTIIDLTVPGKYKIVRPGVQFLHVQEVMQQACIELKT